MLIFFEFCSLPFEFQVEVSWRYSEFCSLQTFMACPTSMLQIYLPPVVVFLRFTFTSCAASVAPNLFRTQCYNPAALYSGRTACALRYWLLRRIPVRSGSTHPRVSFSFFFTPSVLISSSMHSLSAPAYTTQPVAVPAPPFPIRTHSTDETPGHYHSNSIIGPKTGLMDAIGPPPDHDGMAVFRRGEPTCGTR